jgi:ribosomal protein L1
MPLGKKHKEARDKVDRSRRYTFEDAVSLVKEAAYA